MRGDWRRIAACFLAYEPHCSLRDKLEKPSCRAEQKSSKIVLQSRPIFSITYRIAIPTLWYWPGCVGATTRVNTEFLVESWVQDHLQKHLQLAEMSQSHIQAAKLGTLPICLIQQQIAILASNRAAGRPIRAVPAARSVAGSFGGHCDSDRC